MKAHRRHNPSIAIFEYRVCLSVGRSDETAEDGDNFGVRPVRSRARQKIRGTPFFIHHAYLIPRLTDMYCTLHGLAAALMPRE